MLGPDLVELVPSELNVFGPMRVDVVPSFQNVFGPTRCAVSPLSQNVEVPTVWHVCAEAAWDKAKPKTKANTFESIASSRKLNKRSDDI